MPNRILREGIIDSEKVNSLNWQQEVFYRRLISIADDFGRYDGRNDILRAKLYPLQLDKISSSDIGKLVASCAAADLVRCYKVDGKPYLEIAKFDQQIRIKKSKYPAPTDAKPVPPTVPPAPPADDNKPQASANNLPPDAGNVLSTCVADDKQTTSTCPPESIPNPKPKEINTPEAPPPAVDGLENGFKVFQDWIKANAETVSKMKEPFTIIQFEQLKKQFKNPEIKELLTAMHNYKPLLAKNNSAYLTMLSWAKRRQETGTVTQTTKPPYQPPSNSAPLTRA